MMSEVRVGDMTSPHMKWFLHDRFGMFIHWGAYSQLARGEWVMNRERIPVEEYEPIARAWNPDRFDADEWVAMAQDAGMKYLVCTTKHHDGFCLFDSKLTDYTSAQSDCGRDLMGELADACHSAGMKLGFYYSLKDWHHPDYECGADGDTAGHGRFLEYTHGQVRELCSNYGKLDIMWYDGGGLYDGEGWQAERLNAMVRELQPEIIINDRSRIPEDYDTPEQHVRASGPGRAWETCMTMNGSWGWHAGDAAWKSTRELIGTLARIAGLGANLLLNVGPLADGTFPPQAVERLGQIGQWMRANSEAIYGTVRCPLQWGGFGQPTCVGNNLYLVCTKWLGAEATIGMIKSEVKSATLLATGQDLAFEQSGDRLTISGLPEIAPCPYAPVIRLEFDETPEVYAAWR
jgi:alpha-L-fucosidase